MIPTSERAAAMRGGIRYVGRPIISESYSGGGKNCPPRSETPCKRPKFLSSTGNNFVFKQNSSHLEGIQVLGDKRGHSLFERNFLKGAKQNIEAGVSDPIRRA